jgi:hypothetical protein
VTDNGILAKIPGDFISAGMRQLPPPAAGVDAQPRAVTVQVPDHGAVQIAYALASYRHGRSRRWHWVAVRADLAP